MKPFINTTTNNTENAIRRGAKVPDGGVNLAWTQTPSLDPSTNIVVLDTSRIINENVEDVSVKRKLMYANLQGILEDFNGNQIVDEEFPFITDVFSVDENFLTTPGSEYTDEDVLPFVHISRYFHLDYPGLTLGSALQPFRSSQVKVVDGKGKDYIHADGSPRYRINVTPAYATIPVASVSAAYRLFIFVDDDINEDLYLKYDKVEINEATGTLKNQDISYLEILNPQPYFQYQPEESDIVDPANRRKKWFSSKPISAKDQAIGSNNNSTNGYKIYVPRKAIVDPRIFQMFRWRVNCQFTQTFKTDTTTSLAEIKCGVVEAGSTPCSSPYVFLNLWKSQYNLNGVNFQNPLQVGDENNISAKETRAYWSVPFDTISLDDLKKFDILFWSPYSIQYDFTPYLNKIRYFTETLGRTLIIDLAEYCLPTGLMVTTTAPVDSTGTKYVAAGTSGLADASKGAYDFNISPLLSGSVPLGGWDLLSGSSDMQTLGPFTNTAKPLAINNIPYMQNVGNDYESVWSSPVIAATNFGPQLVHHTTSTGGNVIITTTAAYASCGWIWSTEDEHVIDFNRGVNKYTGADYYHLINSFMVKGAMKLFYNTALLSVKDKAINQDTGIFSSSWSQSTPWKSDWVINAWNDTLSLEEKSKYNFSLLPRGANDSTPVWQKRLSGKTLEQLINETLTDQDIKRLKGSSKIYTIEVSNFQVKTTPGLPGSSPPFAWTEAYSPKFEIPVELGPNIVKEDLIHQEVASSQFANFIYPPRPYGIHLNATFSTTSDHLVSEHVNWTATGTATEITSFNPSSIPVFNPSFPSSTTVAAPAPIPAPAPAPPKVSAPPAPAPPPVVSSTPPAPTTQEIILNWKDHGESSFYTSPLYPEFGMPTPLGISTWQEANYYNDSFGSGSQCWPHFGIEDSISQGSTGDAVHLLQKGINQFQFWGFMNTGVGYLIEDGIFGSKTKTAALAMQSTFKARFIDGVVDAESWGIFGSEILRVASTLNALGKPLVDPADPITHWFRDIQTNMDRRNISNTIGWDVYRKRSWATGGPNTIWELICITFKQDYDIHGITITPYVLGQTNTIMFRSVHVAHIANSQAQGMIMTSYDAANGQLTSMPHRPVHGQPFYLPIGPYRGNTIIIGIGQDGPSGYGTSRQLGVAEIWAHTSGSVPGVVANSPISSTIPAASFNGGVEVQPIGGLTKPSGSNSGSTFRLNWTGSVLSIYQLPSKDTRYDIYHNGSFYSDHIYHDGYVAGDPISVPVGDRNGTFSVRAHPKGNVDLASYTFSGSSSAPSLTWDGTKLTLTTSINAGHDLYHNGAYYADDNTSLYYNGNSQTIPSSDQNGTYSMRLATSLTIDQCSYTFPPPQAAAPPPVATVNFNEIIITASGQANVTTGTDIIQQAIPTYSGGGTLSSIKWTAIADDSIDISSNISADGKVTLQNHNVVIDISGNNFTTGSEVNSGSTAFYSMTTNGILNPGYETGFVSKSDGIKLICNHDKSPYGFPTFPTRSSQDNVAQRHYGTITISSTGSDSSIHYGFYDIRTQEFITNNSTTPTMSYIEYLTRGSNNIYAAVYSSYGTMTQDSLPQTDDAPGIPFRRAMPVYGVGFRHASHIGLEPLPAKLGSEDIWPIPIRTGNFNKVVSIRSRLDNPLTTYIKNFQGTNVKAFYEVPEAQSGWSKIYGRPYIDVVDEEPLILDDNIIQVRQNPILMIQEPSINPNQADPLRPVFTVSQRANVDGPWIDFNKSAIADYNISNGTIYLKDPLLSSDSTLVKVSYTTARSVYNLKQVNNSKLNLNPRLARQNNLFGKPIFVYILPHYVLSADGNVIPDSFTNTTLRFSMDTDVFDPTSPLYDPLAMQLGIVYIVTNLDINNLVILDTRSRGGGAYPDKTMLDLQKSINDASGYWDLGDGAGQSYQKGGFVLLRLPEKLKEQFPDKEDILRIIKRNITAGVQFRIETLQGGQW